jgi:ABC-type sulfate transport system permease component
MKSKKVNEEIANLIKGFDIAFGKAVSEFNDWLLIQLQDTRGRTINQMISEGWIKFNVSDSINSAVYNVTTTSASNL